MRILFLGDVHVGSSHAVFPDHYVNPETGVEITSNRIQKKLLSYWYAMAEAHAPKDSPPDILILMGDLIDGPQRKQNYHTLLLQNVMDQIDVFLKLFIDVWHAKKIYVIRGTDYHVTVEGLHAEEFIARKLPNVQYVSRWSKDRASQVDLRLDIKKHRLKLHAKHQVGISVIPHYRYTPLARDVWKLFMEDLKFHVSRGYNVVVRAHTHIHNLIKESVRFYGFTTPSWQLPTEYAKSRGYYTADIGIVELEVDKNKFNINDDLVTYEFSPHWVTVE
jgi:hypothetical protein